MLPPTGSDRDKSSMIPYINYRTEKISHMKLSLNVDLASILVRTWLVQRIEVNSEWKTHYSTSANDNDIAGEMCHFPYSNNSPYLLLAHYMIFLWSFRLRSAPGTWWMKAVDCAAWVDGLTESGLMATANLVIDRCLVTRIWTYRLDYNNDIYIYIYIIYSFGRIVARCLPPSCPKH